MCTGSNVSLLGKLCLYSLWPSIPRLTLITAGPRMAAVLKSS
jgi:hypothetical protein